MLGSSLIASSAHQKWPTLSYHVTRRFTILQSFALPNKAVKPQLSWWNVGGNQLWVGSVCLSPKTKCNRRFACQHATTQNTQNTTQRRTSDTRHDTAPHNKQTTTQRHTNAHAHVFVFGNVCVSEHVYVICICISIGCLNMNMNMNMNTKMYMYIWMYM